MIKRFRPEDIKHMMEHLRTMGAPFGITFVDRPLLSNSRPALQAAEFAREQGKFGPFHDALFAAYFSHGLDIGNIDVLSQVARETGLDADALKSALETGMYLPQLEATKEEASRFNVTGVPTFIIEEKRSIVGAQPLDVFRRALRSL